MGLSFGTDGVRGVANRDLTPEAVLALGRAAARVLGPGPLLVGRDTRRSGPLLQAALTAGLTGEGVDVCDLGVLPTPAVAFHAQRRHLPAAVISASHNPFADNGVKFFVAGGRKLSAEFERRIEAGWEESPAAVDGPTGGGVGSVVIEGDSRTGYIEHLLAGTGASLGGLRVVVDCANGAASALAAEVFTRAGAEVQVINDAPDGTNINVACGSTHTEALERAVLDAGADAGLALDGDADRVVAVDHRGRAVDGDQVIAICARDMLDRGSLHGETVVVTVMTNLGFRLAMEGAGIAVAETPVGDRYVLEALERGGWSLGGEQSGHIIFRDLATTGDGMLTGLVLLDVVARRGRPLAELAEHSMTRLPQVLRNVRVARRDDLEGAADVWAAVAGIEKRLGSEGRVVLRPSGTEPLVRVMVEAPTDAMAADAAEELCATVARALGAEGPSR